MSQDDTPPKKPARGLKGPTFMPPESMGKMKRDSIFDWSIDEVIAYRQTGVRPRIIIDPNKIHTLARNGASLKVIADLFETTEHTIIDNPAFYSAYTTGRSDLATRNRMNLVKNAEDNMAVAIYLDKLIGGDIEKSQVTLIPGAPQEVKQADTSDLLKKLSDNDE